MSGVRVPLCPPFPLLFTHQRMPPCPSSTPRTSGSTPGTTAPSSNSTARPHPCDPFHATGPASMDAAFIVMPGPRHPRHRRSSSSPMAFHLIPQASHHRLSRREKPSASFHSQVCALPRGQIREEDLVREALAQILRLQQCRYHHHSRDTHKHTHLFPGVTRLLLRPSNTHPSRPSVTHSSYLLTASLMPVSALRADFASLFNSLRPQFQRHSQIAEGRILTTQGTVGVSATGTSLPRLSPRSSTASHPKASSNSSAIPVTTTPSSTASPPAFAPVRDRDAGSPLCNPHPPRATKRSRTHPLR